MGGCCGSAPAQAVRETSNEDAKEETELPTDAGVAADADADAVVVEEEEEEEEAEEEGEEAVATPASRIPRLRSGEEVSVPPPCPPRRSVSRIPRLAKGRSVVLGRSPWRHPRSASMIPVPRRHHKESPPRGKTPTLTQLQETLLEIEREVQEGRRVEEERKPLGSELQDDQARVMLGARRGTDPLLAREAVHLSPRGPQFRFSGSPSPLSSELSSSELMSPQGEGSVARSLALAKQMLRSMAAVSSREVVLREEEEEQQQQQQQQQQSPPAVMQREVSPSWDEILQEAPPSEEEAFRGELRRLDHDGAPEKEEAQGTKEPSPARVSALPVLNRTSFALKKKKKEEEAHQGPSGGLGWERQRERFGFGASSRQRAAREGAGGKEEEEEEEGEGREGKGEEEEEEGVSAGAAAAAGGLGQRRMSRIPVLSSAAALSATP